MVNNMPTSAEGQPTSATSTSHTATLRPLWIKLGVLSLLAIGLIVLFMTYGVDGHWDFTIPHRGRKVLAMLLVGYAIGVSTLIFMTITNNRILTPSIIGFDALFVLIQTVIVFFLGASTLATVDVRIMFVINTLLLVVFAGLLYRWLFGREGQNLYYLVLVGVIFGTFFSSITTFLQRIIDPNEFVILQDALFASFNLVDEDLLLISVVIVVAATIYASRYAKYLDVVSLGRDTAVALGVDHKTVVNRLMIVIAVLVAVSTALVGPTLFFGLLAANLAHQMMRTYRHRFLLPATALIGIAALLGGQFLIEHVFDFSTTLSVIINFIGGAYFIYLLLREAKS